MKIDNYILSAHNTFTYLKPKNILHYLCIPFARCQSKDIYKLYREGIRCFDIRVRFTKYGDLKLCHGLFETQLEIPVRHFNVTNNIEYLTLEKEYKSSDFVDWLLSIFPQTEKIYFRLVLETTKEDKNQEYYFKNFCEEFDFIKKIRKHNDFFVLLEGVRKFDWKRIATNIKSEEQLSTFQHISSYPSYKESIKVRWYERICPWLYAKRTNKLFKENISKNLYQDYKILAYDFV